MRLLLLAATVVALVSIGTEPALAAHVQCGDVITADTTLDGDLHCPADGLVIGADDLTLDLGGHLIAAETLFSKGIDNSAGHPLEGVLSAEGSSALARSRGPVDGF